MSFIRLVRISQLSHGIPSMQPPSQPVTKSFTTPSWIFFVLWFLTLFTSQATGVSQWDPPASVTVPVPVTKPVQQQQQQHFQQPQHQSQMPQQQLQHQPQVQHQQPQYQQQQQQQHQPTMQHLQPQQQQQQHVISAFAPQRGMSNTSAFTPMPAANHGQPMGYGQVQAQGQGHGQMQSQGQGQGYGVSSSGFSPVPVTPTPVTPIPVPVVPQAPLELPDCIPPLGRIIGNLTGIWWIFGSFPLVKSKDWPWQLINTC